MNEVQQMVEMQERLYTLRDELARVKPVAKPGVKPDAARREQEQRQTLADRRLRQIESGLYPTCEDCGLRIEIDRLREDAMATQCAHCAAHAQRPSA